MGTSSAMSTSNQYIKYKITVTENWQSISENYTSVNVKVNFYRTNTGYTSYGTGTVYCKINGTTYTASVSPSQKITNSGITLFNRDVAVYHNNDGTKTLTCSAWISHDVVSSSEQSYSQTLTTIPRTSKLSLSSSSVTMGNTVTISTNRASTSFTHSVYYQIGTGGWNVIATGVTNSYTWTVPTSLANNTPNSTTLNLNIILETYSGSSYIGSSSTTLKTTVPSGYVPTINSITLSESVSGLASQFGGFVKGKSKIKVAVSASGTYSSTIKSYSSKINNATYTASTFTTDVITSGGSCQTTIKDSRGRSATKSQSYTILDYSNPVISKFTVVRCNSDGTENDEGNCCKCTINASISAVNNKNTKTFSILYKKKSDTSYTTQTLSNSSYTLNTTQILTEIDTESEYEVILQVKDYFTTVTKSRDLSTAYTLVDYNASGKGIAFGKVSTGNVMDINMDIHANDLIRMGYGTNEEKNIRFQNLAEAQGKTYDTDGIYPHSCKMYGGSGGSPIGIGWWDSQNEYRILAFSDHDQKLIYGSKGLYSSNTAGAYLNHYGNVVKQTADDTGSWNVVDGYGNTIFRTNWGDKKISGNIGGVHQVKQLYSNDSGSSSTITTSDNMSKYAFIEVHYKSNDNNYGSLRCLYGTSAILFSSTPTDNKTYFKTSKITIGDTNITWNVGSECNIGTGGTCGMTANLNNLKIVRVFGYM